MSTQAMALAKWLPDIETQTPNSGDVVQVLSIPVNQSPITQFAPKGSGGGGGSGILATTTKVGQFLVSGPGPLFTPTWDDADGGRF
jgi:hypothetical protein